MPQKVFVKKSKPNVGTVKIQDTRSEFEVNQRRMELGGVNLGPVLPPKEEKKSKAKSKGAGAAGGKAQAPTLADTNTPAAEKRAKYEDLPLISVLPSATMKSALTHMQRDIDLQQLIAAYTQERKDIKAILVEIAEQNKKLLPGGMRHGRIVVYYNGLKTPMSLNRGLLLENGVTPGQLEASMKAGKQYADLKIVDLDKPKKSAGADDEDE